MAEAGTPAAESFEELTRALRGSLASLRAAAETLEQFPTMEAEQQRRLRAVVSGEARRLGQLVDRLETLAEKKAGSERPARRRTTAAELAATLAARAFAQLGLAIEREESEPAELEIEFENLVQAAVGLLEALRRNFAVSALRLRQKVVENHAVIDLLWLADEESLQNLRDWQSEALEGQKEGLPGLRPTLRRHGGEAWFNVERDSTRAYLRLLLPVADP